MDKKIILKEIEVLIRSIKVHYDNIENEYRIPTIELELITSKIRKLHEKSIIYNHLHYMEEELSQQMKKMRLDVDAYESGTSKSFGSANDFNDSEPIHSIGKEEAVLEQIKLKIKEEFDVKVVNIPIEEKEEEIAAAPAKQVKNIASKIGINDRFRFVKDLFDGNGLLMEENIQTLNNCANKQQAEQMLQVLKQKFNWNEENESVIDFNGIVISLF